MKISIDFESGEFQRQLSRFGADAPKVAQKAIRATNRAVIKKYRKEAKSRGYKAHKKNAKGEDVGYAKNIFQYGNRDYTGKIFISSAAYYYRFIEYGANVRPRHGKYLAFKVGDEWKKARAFTIPARPILSKVADEIWKKEKLPEFKKAIQKEMTRIFGGS